MSIATGRRIRLFAAVAAIAVGALCLLDAAGATAAVPGSARTGRQLMALRDGTAQVPGMDVSGHQGNVDWNAAYRDGARFAYVKATEGTGYVNPYFGQQYDGSYQVGMIRGAYHFALPDRSTGAAQADYFVGHGGGWSADGRTMPPMLDIEYNPYGNVCFGLSPDAMTAWIKDFSDEVHAKTTRWPMMYTTTDWWKTCTGNRADFSATNPLFVARYASSAGELPAKWDYYTLWQYSDSGKFPGDQDQFNGTLDRLRALAGAQPEPSAPATSTSPPRPSAPRPTKPVTSTPASSARPTSTASTTPKPQGAEPTMRGLIWAGATTPPIPAPTKLAPRGVPIAVAAAAHRDADTAPVPAPAPTAIAPAAPTTATTTPSDVPEPVPAPAAAAPAPPSNRPVENAVPLAHTGSRPLRAVVLGVSLLLLGFCLLLIRREVAPRPSRTGRSVQRGWVKW